MGINTPHDSTTNNPLRNVPIEHKTPGISAGAEKQFGAMDSMRMYTTIIDPLLY